MSTPQRTRPVHILAVTRTEWVTPHMVRVWAGGPGLATVPDNGHTDNYVKLLFFPEGRPEGIDVDGIAELRAQGRVVTRTYTIRRREASELAIDFVHHGDVGLAGPWAASVQPGTEFSFQGPGGAYSPAADADWHLFVGDASALPAIGAAIESLPPGAVALAVVEVDEASDEQKFLTDAQLDLRWVPAGTLVDAVAALELPAGSGHAFVHGETGVVRELRKLVSGIDRLSISGYWRRGMAEPEFQAAKRTDPV